MIVLFICNIIANISYLKKKKYCLIPLPKFNISNTYPNGHIRLCIMVYYHKPNNLKL